MIPRLPPPIPPWPGFKPPGQAGEQEANQGGAQPSHQNQGAAPQGPGVMPILHGLVPPQMTRPTYPVWFVPHPVWAQTQAQVQALQQAPQQAQQPVQLPIALPVQQQAQRPVAQQPRSAVPPVMVERSDPEVQNSQPFQPVFPVAGVPTPSLPTGARQRQYWF